jgi:hypothetical protein
MSIVDTIVKHNHGIIGTLAVHMLLFVWFNLENMSFTVIDPKEKVVAVLDYINDSPIIEIESLYEEDLISQEITNVTVNNNLQETQYTNDFNQEKADQEVLDELKQLESDEFKNISLDNPELLKDEQTNINTQLIDENATKNKAAAFGNNIVATASYSLPNRTSLHQKIPSYQCKEEGIVRLIIKVNQKGKVVQFEIDEQKTSTTNECLRNAALDYVNYWRFNQDFNDNIKKEGWVEFKYLKQ